MQTKIKRALLLLYQVRPNAPLTATGVTGTEDSTGAIDLDWDDMDGAESYVIHCSPANDPDPHNAIYMFYSETSDYRFTPSKLQAHEVGDDLYFWVQTFNVKGVGANETEKAEYLNTTQLGSAWSDVVKITTTK